MTAGDPDYETSLKIIKGLPKAGADIIEFGMPFTDPMADGPAIQAAGLRALKAGQTLNKTLELVRDFRAGDKRHARRADGLLQSRSISTASKDSLRTPRRPASTA